MQWAYVNNLNVVLTLMTTKTILIGSEQTARQHTCNGYARSFILMPKTLQPARKPVVLYQRIFDVVNN